MNGDLLRIVDSIHRDKNIPKEIVFQGIESALVSAARKHFSDEADITIVIDRESGRIDAEMDGEAIAPVELGRIAAQSAKQVMIQKIREAERDAVFDEYEGRRGEIVNGTIQRFEGGTLIVNLGKTEGILPRGEQIPGETNHPGGRVRCVVVDVRKSGSRVKIILSRTHADFVRRLFEIEVPEIAERVIEVKAMAREAGYRTKVAVSSIDTKVDCVGACVGVRGSRIKNIVDELGGEKIDIVRWNDSMQVLIPNALKPAEIDDVLLCGDLMRATVVVREDQLSLAIGRRGQNVRLASRLSGWDIDILTAEELQQQLARTQRWFTEIPGVGPMIVEKLVEKGYYTFDDLAVLDPAMLTSVEGIGDKKAEEIIAYAAQGAVRVEREESERLAREKAEGRARAIQQAAAQSQQEREASRVLGPDEAAEQIFGPSRDPEPSEAEAEPTSAETSEAEAEATSAETSEAEPASAETSEAEAAGAETSEAEPASAETSEAEAAGAETSEAEPADAETSEAEPASAETSDVDTVDTQESPDVASGPSGGEPPDGGPSDVETEDVPVEPDVPTDADPPASAAGGQQTPDGGEADDETAAEDDPRAEVRPEEPVVPDSADAPVAGDARHDDMAV